MIRLLLPAVLLLVLVVAAPTRAIEPQEQLADSALEGRARQIGQELRCLVCQNESIEDSDADLARDLRRIVRERLTAGDSDRKVVAFVVARYGDFVLLSPPLRIGTFMLWFGPSLLLTSAFAWLLLRPRTRTDVEPLTDEESRRLTLLMEEERS
jgi:cytochrome c-type biogenesis protein CcmH